MHVNIVVIGAGLVGSAVACALAQGSGELSIYVVDSLVDVKAYNGDDFDPRVVALSPGSIRFLKDLNVWQNVAQKACSYQKMSVWDGEGNGSIAFDCADIHAHRLGSIVENSAVLISLRDQLAAYRNIEFVAPAELVSMSENDGVSLLTLDNGQSMSADFVVAADGASSKMRTLAGIKTSEWDYGHHAIITTVKTQFPHQFTAWQRFSHQGPLAFLPLTGRGGDDKEHYCSIVWSLLDPIAADYMAQSDQQFCENLARTFEHRLGNIEWVDKRFCIPLRQRHAMVYGKPGFALVGDSAHTIHPLAGQGVNLGLADAKSLCEELLRAQQRNIALTHPSIVKRFQRSRKPNNLLTMRAMEAFKHLFGDQSLSMHSIRNRGMDWVDRSSWIKRIIIENATS